MSPVICAIIVVVAVGITVPVVWVAAGSFHKKSAVFCTSGWYRKRWFHPKYAENLCEAPQM